MSSFVHLHVHSGYSLLDSAAHINVLVDRARELSMEAIALTDHGNMYGIIDFYQKASEAGIKPIVGCEVYIDPLSRFKQEEEIDLPQSHLVLLVRNNIGYQNLLRIVTLGFREGFYYSPRPRVNREILEKHSEGITALSGCMQGEIPNLLLEDRQEEAEELAKYYTSVFGAGHFYLELQDHGINGQKKINMGLREISQKTGIPLVATNNVHYIHQEDATAHDVLLCIQGAKKINDEERMRFKSREFYLKSVEEMASLFQDYPEAINNSLKIAEECQLELPFNQNYFPDYGLPDGKTEVEHLRELCYEGLQQRYHDIDSSLKERLDYELNVIEQLGYCSYFLIIWDLIRHARERGIMVGPGRGAAPGSLVAYCLRITNIDPVKHGLLFERFVNQQRGNMPHIVIDIDNNRREEILSYLENKYGQDRVAQVLNFGRMTGKLVVRDVGRTLNISKDVVDKIAQLIPFEPNMSVDRALEHDRDLQSYYKQESYRELLDISMELEGLPRFAMAHAARLVLARDPLVNYVPLQKTIEGRFVTQFPSEKLADIGLFNIDLLGLKSLGIIEKTLASIKHRQGLELDIEEISLEEEATFDLLSRGETEGIFYLESAEMKNVLRDFHPGKFEDLIALIVISHLNSHLNIKEQMNAIVNRKQQIETVEYPHPVLEKILKETYGVIFYYEQVMQIAAEIAGFSLEKADLLIRNILKKNGDKINEHKDLFIRGCLKKGYTEQLGEEIFSLIMKFTLMWQPKLTPRHMP